MRGFVPTPDRLVDRMVDLLFEGRAVGPADRVLDPGCGEGAFMKGVLRWAAAARSPRPSVTGIELDGRLVRAAACHLPSDSRVSVVEGDFLGDAPSEQFDYVVGNPPYVSILRLGEREKADYRARYRTATGRFDLYTLFFERALDLLAPGGRLVFVTPEKFAYVDSASSLRALLGAHRVRRLEFVPEDTFGDLAAYPLITVVEKGGGGRTQIVDRNGVEKEALLPRGGESWAPFINGSRPGAQPRTGDVLSAACDRVSCGVATGADAVFVFDLDELPDDLRRFAWPTVAGRDLDASRPSIETRSVMLAPYDADGALIPFDDLGPLGRYLADPRVASALRKRACVSRKPWYAFHETPRLSQILRPKILCKDIARAPAFWVDRSGLTLPRHSTYYMTPRDESMLEPLCEYLNGRQAREWLVENCQRASNGFIRSQSNVLKRLPIPPSLLTHSWPRPRPAPTPSDAPQMLEMIA